MNLPAPFTHSTPLALKRLGDSLRHLLDDAGLPLVGRREVEVRAVDVDAELRELLVGLVQERRRLHPGLGRDAADPQARAAERIFLLDAHDLRTQLRGANRCGVAAGPTAQDSDVTIHFVSSSLSAWPAPMVARGSTVRTS